MACVLHAFEALGEEIFHGVVLSPLIQDGTAAKLTLACHQLRHLSQRATKELSFTRGNCIPTPQQLPERFPSCSGVTLTVKDSSDFSVTYPPLLAVLARYVFNKLFQMQLPAAASLMLMNVFLADACLQVATSAVPAAHLGGGP